MVKRVDDVDRRLRVFGLAEPSLRVLQAQLLDRVPEHVVSSGAELWEPPEQTSAHPLLLDSLPREDVASHQIRPPAPRDGPDEPDDSDEPHEGTSTIRTSAHVQVKPAPTPSSMQ